MNHEPDRRRQQRQQAIAWEWVSRVLSICVVMLLPAFGGRWIDQRMGTGYWVIVGLAIGFSSGMTALIQLVKRDGGRTKENDR